MHRHNAQLCGPRGVGRYLGGTFLNGREPRSRLRIHLAVSLRAVPGAIPGASCGSSGTWWEQTARPAARGTASTCFAPPIGAAASGADGRGHPTQPLAHSGASARGMPPVAEGRLRRARGRRDHFRFRAGASARLGVWTTVR
jgi:hypothetical protein